MRRNELDYILGTMLEFRASVSDLIFTVDKPPQVEAEGVLVPVPMEPALEQLTPFQTETIALNLIGGNPRLLDDLLRTSTTFSGRCSITGPTFPTSFSPW